MRIFFVIPDPEAFTSGGNLLNKHLVHALQDKGAAVNIIDWKHFQAIYREWAPAAWFFDTLYLDQVREFKGKLKQSFLIVHYLESMRLADKEPDPAENQILKRFTGFLSFSAYTRSFLAEKGFANQWIMEVMPALCFDPEPELVRDTKLQVLLVANLIEVKGVLPFLLLLRESSLTAQDCHVRIAGAAVIDPVYALAVIELIDTDPKLREMVTYEGECNRDRMQALYRAANLYVSTSMLETFGMALQEAVAHGLPILAYAAGNVAFHVEEALNGHLFREMEELVGKMTWYAAERDLFLELAERAWEYRESHMTDWGLVADSFLDQLKIVRNQAKR